MPRFDDDPSFLVTLGLDPATFDRLDALRQQYFPPERNQVPAHISLFHHLPGVEWESIDATLNRIAQTQPPISLRFTGVKPTGRGVLLSVQAAGLITLRGELAGLFARDLTPQDRQPYHPHVMIMNKAERSEADQALREIQASWTSWTGTGDRLILWRYLGGPWDEAANYPFVGPARATVR